MAIPLFILGVAVVMVTAELNCRRRAWPNVAGWWARAALLNGVQVGVVYLSGVAWNGWMVAHRPWSAGRLGVTGGALLGYLAITFIYYWWHRWRHESDFLWRWFHQVHHSPQRIEIITSFYKHPFEILVNSLLSSAILYWLVGVGPVAASYAVLMTGLAELFYHWNVSTPYWLGFLFQRPESHCIHHQQGLHSYNYADLPFWDMIFKTFRNPRRFRAACGFENDGEQRLPQMLLGADLTSARTHGEDQP